MKEGKVKKLCFELVRCGHYWYWYNTGTGTGTVLVHNMGTVVLVVLVPHIHT